jgi:hypothetical protein
MAAEAAETANVKSVDTDSRGFERRNGTDDGNSEKPL